VIDKLRGARAFLYAICPLVALAFCVPAAQANAPANDEFSAAATLSPSLPISRFDSNVEATKEAGEPLHAGEAGGHSVWYSWTPTVDTRVGVSTNCGALDPLLAVYTGSAVNALTPVASNEELLGLGCFFSNPEFEFDAAAGTTYWIAVDGRDENQGTFELKLNPPPDNDNFASASSIGAELPQSAFGSTKVATKETGEPNHAGDVGGHSVWYSWTPSDSGPVEISTCTSFTSNLDAVLAVYTGSILGGLTPVAANDDGSGAASYQCSFVDSAVEFEAVAGTTYRIAVDGASGSVGTFDLRLNGHPANDSFESPEVLPSALPLSVPAGTNRFATKQPGEPDHAGDTGGASVWYSWTPSSNGAAAISACTFSESFNVVLGVYTGAAVNALSPVAASGGPVVASCGSDTVEAQFQADVGTTYLIAVDGEGGDEGRFTLSVEGPPANDAFSAAQELGADLPTAASGTTRRATKEPNEPNHGGDVGGHSVWYSWTPTSSGPVDLSVCSYGENGFVAVLAMYTGSGLGSLTPVVSAESKSTECGPNPDTTQLAVTAGTKYWIAVDGKGGAQGRFGFEMRGRQPNDEFASAETINPDPLFVSGSNRFASKEPNEPNHAGNPGGHSLWYSWTPSASGPVSIEGCDSSGHLDTLLAVYTGSAVNALTEVASNDDAGGEPPNTLCASSTRSLVAFEAAAGTTYKIAVDGKDGGEGKFVLIFSRGEATTNDDFDSATPLTSGLPLFGSGSNKGASKAPGEPNHAGNAGGHSLWFSWTARKSAPIALSACAQEGAFDTLLAVYTGSAVNALTEVASNDDATGASAACGSLGSEVRLNAVAGTTYRIAVDGKNGGTGPFFLAMEGVARNDDFGKPTAIASVLPNLGGGSNRFATKQSGEPDHAGSPGGSSIWFKWTAPRSEPVSVDTCGSGFDTLLGIYTGSTLDDLVPVAANDDGGGLCGQGSRLTFDAVANTVYRIAVDGKGGAQGTADLSLNGHPKEDEFAKAAPLSSSMTSYSSGANLLASKQTGEPNHGGDPGGHSVWYSWTPLESGREVLSICSKDFEPLLGVYAGTAVDALVPVPVEAGSVPGCSAGGSLTFDAVAGTTYKIAVDGRGGDAGHFELSLEPFDAPPSEPPPGDGGGQGGGGAPGDTVSPPGAPSTSPPPAKRPSKLKRCKPGFVRKTVHGKRTCVKKKRLRAKHHAR